MKANLLDVTAARPRVWRKLLMVVAVAPAMAVQSSPTSVPSAPSVATHAAARPEPPPPAPAPEPPPPRPRTLPSGAPACGNVTSRAPRPESCEQ